MARLSPEQQQNVATILRVGRQKGASKKVLKAALEAGLVESNLRNLGYGDRDSVGVFQQRPSAGWTGLTNVAKAAAQFYDHAIPLSRKYASAGQLAQAVQRSAFPARYDQRSGDANSLLSGVASAPTSSSTPTASPATDNQDAIKKQIALSLLGFGNLSGDTYGSADPLTMALVAARGSTSRVSPPPAPSAPQSGGNPGLLHLAKIANKKFGLTIREFAPYDKVDPVHTKGSYHYSNRAFDASGSPQNMAAFDKYVATRYGKWVKELFYDPGKNLKNGKPTTPIGGHSDHVHLAE